MNIYCLATIVFGITSFSVGFEVLIRRKDYVGVCYFIVSCLYAVWGTSVGLGIGGALPYEDSLFQARLHNLSALFVPVAWFHFVAVYTNNLKWKNNALWLYLIPLPAAIFFNTNWFVPGLQETWKFPYYATPGVLFHLSPVLFFTLIPLSFKILFDDLKNQTEEVKKSRKKFITIAIIGYLAGSLTYLSVYGFNIPQYGLLALPLYPFGLAYFMSSSGLFDEERIAHAAHKDKLAALGILTASINHEIRGPLFAMRGAVETEQDQSQMKTKLLSQIDRLTSIVSRLTHFAKKGVDEAAKIEPLELKEIVANVRPLLQHQFSYQSIQYEQNIPSDLPKVLADRRYLEEILFNLLINACQALKNTEQSQIKLSASVFERDSMLATRNSKQTRSGFISCCK